MKYILILILMVLFRIEEPNKTIQLSDSQRVGMTPRFTTDAKGKPVLSWVEKDGDKGNYFFFAKFNDGGVTFENKIKVSIPEKFAVHAEGMPEIAFKKNGEVLALFELSKPTPTERFAGNIYFTSSKDEGKTWSEP